MFSNGLPGPTRVYLEASPAIVEKERQEEDWGGVEATISWCEHNIC